ncbi:unnamed protein product [Diamesa tonsa]
MNTEAEKDYLNPSQCLNNSDAKDSERRPKRTSTSSQGSAASLRSKSSPQWNSRIRTLRSTQEAQTRDSKVITTQPAPLASKDEEFDIDYDKVGIEEKLITKEVITSAKQQVLKEVQVQQKPQTKKVAVDKKVCMNVGEESVNLSPCPHYPNQQKGQDAAPPAYSEVYPSAPQDFTNPANIGWQNNVGPQNMVQQPIMQPQVYQQQVYQGLIPNQQMQQPPIITILQNQSRVGMYPVKLSPCPHCQKDGSTMIKYDNTIRTHLFSLILCLFCCCPCAAAPYLCTDSCRCLKNPSHFCSNCKSYIGTYNNNPLAL